MKPFYQLTKEEIIVQFKTTEQGLMSAAIPGLQQEYGENALQETKPKSKLTILAAQFADVMILILLIAAVISHHLILFSREASSGRQNASNYSVRLREAATVAK